MDFFNNSDPGDLQEEATILSIFLLVIGMIIPVLQEIALIGTILVAFGTLFLNRKKYWKEIKELWNDIKNQFKKWTKF